MSQFTNHGENRLCDKLRGQSVPYGASWWVAPLSVASGDAFTEITGAGLVRAAVPRSLTAWAGTQGAASTTSSNGTSHVTSNNAPIALGTASGSGSLVGLGFFDAASGGNCWMVWRLSAPLAFSASDVVSFPAATVAFALGLTGGMTDYLANRFIDEIFRGVVYSWPLQTYASLFTAPPSNAGGGTEVGGGVGYSRPSLSSSLTAISGTQGANTTTTSVGTEGVISNNVSVSFPQPQGSWGTLTHSGWQDAATAGNLLFWGALDQATTIGATSAPPTFSAGAARWSLQ